MLLAVRFEVRFEARLEFRLGFKLYLKPAPLTAKLLFSSGLLLEDSRGLVSFALSPAPNEKFGMLGAAGLFDCCGSVLPNLKVVDGALNIVAVPLLSRLPNENRLLLGAAGGLLAVGSRVEFCCCLFRSDPNVNAAEEVTGFSRLLFASVWLSPKLKELLDSLELFRLLFVAVADG